MILIGLAFIVGFILLMTFVFSFCDDIEDPFTFAMKIFWLLIGLGCVAIFLYITFSVIMHL